MTLVLVHGFLGGSAQWDGQVEALEQDVLTVDLPGFAKNAHLPPLNRISDFADWVLQHLTDKGITAFDLLGHSMGGMIVQEMTARAPDRVRRLILYGTGPVGELPGRFEPIEVSKARAQEYGAQATARRIAATWFLKETQAEAYPACAEIAEQASLDAILAGLNAMQHWQGEAHLATVSAPTLVIWGDQDRTYPWRQTEKLWRGISGANLAVLPSCAHAVHLERPEVFNAILTEFLHTAPVNYGEALAI